MSEAAETTATETATEVKPTETETATTAETKDWQAEAEKWKALSRKNEDNAKANSTAAKKLAEIEAAQLSETEKLTKRAEEAEKRAADFESATLKATVAAEKGVPAELLAGATREDLEAAADLLLKFAGDKAASSTTTDFGAGRVGTQDIGDKKVAQVSREQLKKMTPGEIVAAKREGRLTEIMTPRK